MIHIEEAIAFVEAGLADAEREAGSYADDPDNFHARHRIAMEALAHRVIMQFGGRISTRWDGARVRIAGISSTSTGGLGGAFHNWLTAARRKAGAA